MVFINFINLKNKVFWLHSTPSSKLINKLINYPIVLHSVDGIKESFPLCVAQGSELPSYSHGCRSLPLVPFVAPLGFHFPLEGPDVVNI